MNERRPQPPVERREERILAAEHEITAVIGGIERLFVVEQFAHAPGAALVDAVTSERVSGRFPC